MTESHYEQQYLDLMARIWRDGDERVDRTGMPAVATAVIVSKDAYNDADPVERCEQQAQELAELLEENRSFVSPVLVTVSNLPTERPANMVHGPELAEYIRSYRVEVFSPRRLQQIVTQLSGQTPAQLKTAA